MDTVELGGVWRMTAEGDVLSRDPFGLDPFNLESVRRTAEEA
jgi:hypothetical protein